MEDNGFEIWLDNPEQQDHNGNICDQKNDAGCRVTHYIAHPKMCIIMDEVRNDMSQKGDGHIGDNLLVCTKGMVPQKKSEYKR